MSSMHMSNPDWLLFLYVKRFQRSVGARLNRSFHSMRSEGQKRGGSMGKTTNTRYETPTDRTITPIPQILVVNGEI